MNLDLHVCVYSRLRSFTFDFLLFTFLPTFVRFTTFGSFLFTLLFGLILRCSTFTFTLFTSFSSFRYVYKFVHVWLSTRSCGHCTFYARLPRFAFTVLHRSRRFARSHFRISTFYAAPLHVRSGSIYYTSPRCCTFRSRSSFTPLSGSLILRSRYAFLYVGFLDRFSRSLFLRHVLPHLTVALDLTRSSPHSTVPLPRSGLRLHTCALPLDTHTRTLTHLDAFAWIRLRSRFHTFVHHGCRSRLDHGLPHRSVVHTTFSRLRFFVFYFRSLVLLRSAFSTFSVILPRFVHLGWSSLGSFPLPFSLYRSTFLVITATIWMPVTPTVHVTTTTVRSPPFSVYVTFTPRRSTFWTTVSRLGPRFHVRLRCPHVCYILVHVLDFGCLRSHVWNFVWIDFRFRWVFL